MSDLGAKQFAVQVLRNLGHRGGTASVHQLAPNAERYTLTAKAWAAIGESRAPAEAAS